jgi:hypothetical protein
MSNNLNIPENKCKLCNKECLLGKFYCSDCIHGRGKVTNKTDNNATIRKEKKRATSSN